MTTGETIGLIAAITAAAILCMAMINHRMREAEFQSWIGVFEIMLGAKVPEHEIDSILRDLFADADITIEHAVELYRDMKE